MDKPIITVITPTTGKDSLKKLINSLDNQSVPFVHILLWDDKREGAYLYPDPKTFVVADPFKVEISREGAVRYSIVVPGNFVKGSASGSALRAIGLMAANTEYVTFADDDVWYDLNHLENMLSVIQSEKKEWVYCRRKIWTAKGEYLGEDHFESVGSGSSRKVPYEMVDNNTMMFSRRFGTSGACLYRETTEYNDDRLMYTFLKEYAGEPAKSEAVTVNQVCPARLEQMFRQNCTKRSK